MKIKPDKYFLEEACPYTKRRKVKWKTVKWTGISILVCCVLSLLIFTPDSGSKKANSSQTSTDNQNKNSDGNNDDHRNHEADPFNERVYARSAKPTRQYSAGQLVKRSDGGNNGDKLPMGSTIAAKLVNAVLTTDSNSPIIAEIPEDIIWRNSVIIPANTRVIGQGSLDPSTERLQVRFSTFVYPEGDQHELSAIALLPDGSSGIAGDFHSRAFKKQAGRFFGNFVGGLAQGMKEKDPAGQYGMVFEPGSLKNGLLNGAASSAFDQANSITQDTEKLNPFLEVPSNTPFVIYLEKEYSP